MVVSANATSSSSASFCDLKRFETTYASIHIPLSFLVCVFGSVANILNICVLTTKEMRWPTNLILTALAVADLLVMLEYIPFTFHRYASDRKHDTNFSYNWAAFTVFHAVFTQVFHFISCCLTVVLAVWRFIIISNPHKTRTLCSMQRTLYIILATYFLCPIICSPIYLSLAIIKYNHTTDPHGALIDKKDLESYTGPTEVRTIYYTKISERYQLVSLWVYGVVIKLVPCILLTYLSWRLIAVLVETKQRRRLLINSALPLSEVNSAAVKPILHKKIDKDNRQADRTSSMLVAVLLLFLITEFPQAILGLLSAIVGERFQNECYTPLGDVMDILALTNSAINFILYCTMSRQFRSTFREVFRPRIFRKWLPLSQQIEKNGEKTQLSQV